MPRSLMMRWWVCLWPSGRFPLPTQLNTLWKKRTRSTACITRCLRSTLSISWILTFLHWLAELKSDYQLMAVPAVFAKLRWNFRLWLSVCSSLAGNRQCITDLSIYYRDMTSFDGLYLKKLRSPCSVLEKISSDRPSQFCDEPHYFAPTGKRHRKAQDVCARSSRRDSISK